LSENAVKYAAVFVIVGVLLVGFYLIIPGAYDKINATDLGAEGNKTLDDAYTLMLNNQSVYGWVFIALAALAVVSAVMAFGRRS
jgi:disulfide bond formation protein DsbB